MRIVRFLDASGETVFGREHDDGTTTRIDGKIFGSYHDSGDPVTVEKLLSPVSPPAVLCIGLNYRKHAEESNAPLPEHPVLFMKMPSSVQHPGDPIVLPRHLESREVDYEGELAVVA